MADHRADRRDRRPSVTSRGAGARQAAISRAEAAGGDADGTPRSQSPAGKRRAAGLSKQRRTVFRRLPSAPIALGVVALAVSAGGALSAANPDLIDASSDYVQTNQPSALSGTSGTAVAGVLTERQATVSRGGRRDDHAKDGAEDIGAQVEEQANERAATLQQLNRQARAYAAELALDRWVLPLEYVQITAVFGQYGLWSSAHTGLDLNADEGDPIKSIARGVVTSVGYDGAYGNKTVVTLEDGTELWYCHQSSFDVSAGEVAEAGEVIGYVGSTGNVTGSHLHIEVRPGAGDPVDPRAAFGAHGVTL